MFKCVVHILAVFTITTANEEALVRFLEGNKRFAAAVYGKVSLENYDRNFLVCPFSAEAILALAHNGAKDETAEEIRSVLQFPNTTEEINEIFKSLLPGLKNNNGYSLHMANKVYVRNNFIIRPKFVRVARKTYQSEVENINFGRRKAAAKAINTWVSRHTEGKIGDLIDFRVLSDDTVAILVNTLYFQAAWRKQFEKHLTLKRSFFKTSADVNQVDTMKSVDLYGYYESNELDAKFLQIPITGGKKVHVVFVLPNQREGLRQLERHLDEVYTAPHFTWTSVHVELPKFKIETTIDFKTILQNLGVNRAFTRADFSGIGGVKGQIYISDVIQKTYINVNEDGVEAAAATGVIYSERSLMKFLRQSETTFIADHPFLFYIQVDNVIIFTGRVVSPTV